MFDRKQLEDLQDKVLQKLRKSEGLQLARPLRHAWHKSEPCAISASSAAAQLPSKLHSRRSLSLAQAQAGHENRVIPSV